MLKRLLIIVLASLCCTSTSWAHSTASELAELSMEDLLEMSMEDLVNIDIVNDDGQKRWIFSQSAYLQSLEGYRSGQANLSNDEVLFRPGETRTSANYPVLPTTIRQRVYVTSLGYTLSDTDTLSVSVPFVRQGTDHISIVPGYPEFLIKSSGIGDIGVSWQRQRRFGDSSVLSLGLGVSLPTGSIDETGDTPRAPGDQQLPYTMQLGSGTYDLKYVASLRRHFDNWSLGGVIGYRQRIGKNDRNYSLGNKLNLTLGANMPLTERLASTISMTFQHAGSIRGQDDEITVPGAFPYPASITDPRNFGGQTLKLEVAASYQFSRRQSLSLTYSNYVRQDLNGVQPQASDHWSLAWSIGFGSGAR